MPAHSENWDYIVVGQGIAGTMLAHFLTRAGCDVLVIDQAHRAASSMKAAGIINPITGRRFAKSWMIEQLLPFAKKTYQELERLLKVDIWTDYSILRALPTIHDENEWLRRSAFPDFEPWFAKEADLSGLEEALKPVRAWGETVGAAQVNMPALLQAFRSHLREKGAIVEDAFHFDKLKLHRHSVEYDGIQARGVIFCEGARAVKNPFFGYLPFVPTKGEFLVVRIPGTSFPKMVKNGVIIVPLENEKYWIGASSRFEYDDEFPTEKQKAWLLAKLEDAIQVPFEVETHDAAIRPTVFDIRPFIGRHPKFSRLCIFNGLGTKGASLAPFFARHFTEYLTQGTPLMDEVNIARFSDRFEVKTR